MKDYKTKNIRNIGIIGHSGSGKTTLVESLLFSTNTIDRLGTIIEKNTISDYDIEEKNRKISINTTIEPCEWNGIKINLIDMPGYFDFVGEMIQGLMAADIALITVSGRSGVKVGTEKAWQYVNRNKMPRAFFINKLDTENSSFKKVLDNLIKQFGRGIVPIQYPIGSEHSFKGVVNVISKEARIYNSKTKSMDVKEIPKELLDVIDKYKNSIIESVAETDENLLDKYFEKGTLSDEEIYKGLINGCFNGELTPVMCGSAIKGIGVITMLQDIEKCFPSSDKFNGNQEKFSARVFKTIADPFVGKLSLFKVMSGIMKNDSIVYNANKKKNEKIGGLYFLRGKSQIATDTVVAGDIAAATKLQYTSTCDTLCEKENPIVFEKKEFPISNMSMAVIAKSKGDEDKISSALNKLLEEDPTLKISRDAENAETIISGIGETHLDILKSKLKNKFGVEVELELPKVPYREMIKKSVDVKGKHKKQSGGHGQYGDVTIKFESREDGKDELLFVDKVVGGVVPRQYIPAVEKGLKECINHGVLAGYPVIRLKATLHDGSYHPVDSSEMAFKVATSIAYKKALKEGESVILEPIMHLEINIPEEYMGDIIADINKKRGRVIGMKTSGKLERVIAEVPESQIFKYTTDLKSITGGRGDFIMKFKGYEEVSKDECEKIIESNKI